MYPLNTSPSSLQSTQEDSNRPFLRRIAAGALGRMAEIACWPTDLASAPGSRGRRTTSIRLLQDIKSETGL
ncbi:hypothetical protein KC357_g125 [Hortaea werneckii]|nr:hypothetical protein KC357_g125 [Hortaea werneckii]